MAEMEVKRAVVDIRVSRELTLASAQHWQGTVPELFEAKQSQSLQITQYSSN